MKKIIKNILLRHGYSLNKLPNWKIDFAESELKLRFDHIISYSMLKDQNKSLSFIQIGAYDGKSNDPIFRYVTQYEWRGVLVEAQKYAFDLLVKNYSGFNNLCFENLAIGKSNLQFAFYKIKDYIPGLPEWSKRVASFYPDIIAKNSLLPKDENIVEQITVECISFETLVEKYNIKNLDLLQVDAEGFDYEIIKMIDFNKIKPSIIHFDHKHCHL